MYFFAKISLPVNPILLFQFVNIAYHYIISGLWDIAVIEPTKFHHSYIGMFCDLLHSLKISNLLWAQYFQFAIS